MKDIDELNEKINNLQQEVDKLTRTNEYIKPVKSKTSLPSFLPIVNLIKSRMGFYFAIPLSICVILFFLKPSFIMENDKKFSKKKLNYKKLLISTLILTALLAIVIFVYFYKKDY
jgi:hypothetical protein